MTIDIVEMDELRLHYPIFQSLVQLQAIFHQLFATKQEYQDIAPLSQGNITARITLLSTSEPQEDSV